MIRDGRIVHEVVYPHPAERIWRALVDADELAIWLMPTDFVAEVGWRFTLDARPTLGVIAGEVLEVDAPRLLRCRWSGEFGATEVSFELRSEPDGTRLRVEHDGWDERRADRRAGFDQGWADKLSKDLPELLKGDWP